VFRSFAEFAERRGWIAESDRCNFPAVKIAARIVTRIFVGLGEMDFVNLAEGVAKIAGRFAWVDPQPLPVRPKSPYRLVQKMLFSFFIPSIHRKKYFFLVVHCAPVCLNES
jgi:hypothetical protein